MGSIQFWRFLLPIKNHNLNRAAKSNRKGPQSKANNMRFKKIKIHPGLKSTTLQFSLITARCEPNIFRTDHGFYSSGKIRFPRCRSRHESHSKRITIQVRFELKRGFFPTPEIESTSLNASTESVKYHTCNRKVRHSPAVSDSDQLVTTFLSPTRLTSSRREENYRTAEH